MKTINELHEILGSQEFGCVDAHIHTHLCDGAADMTVENIANKAKEKGMTSVILTPHFHKQVKDETATLYTDTDEEILIKLRTEIDNYYNNYGKELTILLSAEADILSTDGTTALKLSCAGENALDLVTPTVNYHPLLPLKAVEVTYGRCIAEIHSSGLYNKFADKVGGVEKILESLYETEVNAIMNCSYPCILGHFFAAHSYAKEKYNWFGAESKHIDIIKNGAKKIVEACKKTGAMIDLTGIHLLNETATEKQERDDFFFGLQKWFIALCKEKGVIAVPGTDSHGVGSVGDVEYYKILGE